MKALYSLLLFLLFLIPLSQSQFSFLPKRPLHGVPLGPPRPTLQWTNYLSGRYQSRYEEFFLKRSGVYELFTRMNNSLNYSIFGLASGRYDQTIMGRNGNLFERVHLRDFNALNAHAAALYPKLEKVKRLQDYLYSHNKRFLLVIHPNKAMFQEEDIPWSFRVRNPHLRPIVQAENILKQLGVNYLNLSHNLSKNVFTKTGAHLTTYGKCHAIQKIAAKLNSEEHIFPEIRCPVIGKVPAGGEDIDLGRLLNVFSFTSSLESVPDCRVEVEKSVKAPTTLFVGTSFVYGLLRVLRHSHALDNYDFLFYDKRLYENRNILSANKHGKRLRQTAEHHSMNYVSQFDLVILEVTEPRINQIGSDFLENLDI